MYYSVSAAVGILVAFNPSLLKLCDKVHAKTRLVYTFAGP